MSDLAPLAGLTNLQTLDCHSTQVSDLAPLAGLTNLQTLDCHSTQVSDLAPLAGLTRPAGREDREDGRPHQIRGTLAQ